MDSSQTVDSSSDSLVIWPVAGSTSETSQIGAAWSCIHEKGRSRYCRMPRIVSLYGYRIINDLSGKVQWDGHGIFWVTLFSCNVYTLPSFVPTAII